jgi:hypothetical protein
MYDLWYTIGRAIMDPGLLNAVQTAITAAEAGDAASGIAPAPAFQRVTRRITEFDDAGTQTFLANKPYTSGLLSKSATTGVPGATTGVRGAIWDWMSANPVAAANPPLPPPISVYTAGRFCQFLKVNQFDFVNRIAQANAAYQGALQGADPSTFSERFPAFIGCCLIDGELAGKAATPADPTTQIAATQFGMNTASPEWAVATRTAHGLLAVRNALLSDPNGDWSSLCPDQFDFWEPQNARAII